MEANVRRIATYCLWPLACLALAGCNQQAKTLPASANLEPKTVQVAPVQELATDETVYATGSLAAQDRAVLSAKVPGRVEAILIDLGSPVQEGDLLAQIERRDYELRHQQAEAELAQARARLGISLDGKEDQAQPEKSSIVQEARALLAEAAKNRERTFSLRAEGVIADAEVETAESVFQVATNRYEAAIHEAKNRLAVLRQRQAELELAGQQIKDTEIRAPFPGVVEQRQTSPGEYLSVGDPVLTVVGVDPIRLRLEISEKDAPRVRVGQKVYLRLEGTEERHEGTISRVSPVISPQSRMLRVEADVPNPGRLLRPGSFAKANIVVDENSSGLFVPSSAVLTFAGIQKVFLVEEGKAVETTVSVQDERGGQVEVLGKLKPGDVVVVEPGNLRNGQPVEILARDS